MGAQTLMYLLPKMSNEDRSSIGDDGVQGAMIADDVGYVELSILSDPVCRGYRYEWADLVKWSMITHIKLYPREVRCKPTTKSMQMSSHFHSGLLKGCRFSAGLK
jgi:hypothetical protein